MNPRRGAGRSWHCSVPSRLPRLPFPKVQKASLGESFSVSRPQFTSVRMGLLKTQPQNWSWQSPWSRGPGSDLMDTSTPSCFLGSDKPFMPDVLCSVQSSETAHTPHLCHGPQLAWLREPPGRTQSTVRRETDLGVTVWLGAHRCKGSNNVYREGQRNVCVASNGILHT